MKMSSRGDETLPLSGFSEEFSTDVTVDEDFIPTSQPQSSVSSRVTKSVQSNLRESSEEANSQALSGFIDDTLPPEALIKETQDKSADFIPDTETKRRRIDYSNAVACKKKLAVLEAEDIFDSLWKKQKVPGNNTLELQTSSAICDSPVKMDSPNPKLVEDSITEILVNDSAETVELGDTPIKVPSLGDVEKLETFESYSSGRCEETQVFDNSVLLLDQPGPSSLTKVTPQKLFLNKTEVDELQMEKKNNLNVSIDLGQAVEIEKQNGGTAFQEEASVNIIEQDIDSDSPSVIVRRSIDFKLNVSCLLTINAITKKVVQKAILNVSEKPIPKSPSICKESLTDCNSDKSKRCSTSSSGSVYSDKNGLPFALPKRISAVSDQTCASDSSGEGFAKFIKNKKISMERIPWSNESLLALKMDEIVKGMIDKQGLINRPIIKSPKKKWKRSTRPDDLNHLEHISENSCSCRTLKSETDESPPERVSEDKSSDATEDNIPTSPPEEVTPQQEAVEESIQNVSHEENAETENDKDTQINPEPDKPEDLQFCDGLRVFARWTDKQYYSGVLSGQSKNDKWDVLFDDGMVKAIKQDFIMPAAWLNVGMLVFALVGDNYESGQVMNLKKGENPTYVVQLDNRNKEMMVELSDMSLSDDMASILKENYRPAGVESPQKKADINCDNVVSGKRLREYKTPLRAPPTSRIGSSGVKKKTTSKTKDLETITGTPRKKSDRKGGLRTESGHLVEDKVASADSPLGNEASETPLRGIAKGARGRARPRSLTYELEEKQKRKQKNWLTADGIPIPGPSGVKFRKKKGEERAAAHLEGSSEKMESESVQHAEKNKRKRKAA